MQVSSDEVADEELYQLWRKAAWFPILYDENGPVGVNPFPSTFKEYLKSKDNQGENLERSVAMNATSK